MVQDPPSKVMSDFAIRRPKSEAEVEAMSAKVEAMFAKVEAMSTKVEHAPMRTCTPDNMSEPKVEAGPWQKAWDPNRQAHYYWHAETKEVTWTEPADYGAMSEHEVETGPWQKAWDPNRQAYYYWHAETKEVTWTEPADYGAMSEHIVEAMSELKVEAMSEPNVEAMSEPKVEALPEPCCPKLCSWVALSVTLGGLTLLFVVIGLLAESIWLGDKLSLGVYAATIKTNSNTTSSTTYSVDVDLWDDFCKGTLGSGTSANTRLQSDYKCEKLVSSTKAAAALFCLGLLANIATIVAFLGETIPFLQDYGFAQLRIAAISSGVVTFVFYMLGWATAVAGTGDWVTEHYPDSIVGASCAMWILAWICSAGLVFLGYNWIEEPAAVEKTVEKTDLENAMEPGQPHNMTPARVCC